MDCARCVLVDDDVARVLTQGGDNLLATMVVRLVNATQGCHMATLFTLFIMVIPCITFIRKRWRCPRRRVTEDPVNATMFDVVGSRLGWAGRVPLSCIMIAKGDDGRATFLLPMLTQWDWRSRHATPHGPVCVVALEHPVAHYVAMCRKLVRRDGRAWRMMHGDALWCIVMNDAVSWLCITPLGYRAGCVDVYHLEQRR